MSLSLLCVPLFKDHQYYFEGRPQPWIRGVPHFVGAILVLRFVCYNWSRLWQLQLKKLIGIGTFLFATLFCWSISAYYHMRRYDLDDAEHEYCVQKLDFFGVYLKSWSIWTALCLLTLEGGQLKASLTVFGLELLLIIVSITWFNYSNVLYVVLIGISIIPFLYLAIWRQLSSASKKLFIAFIITLLLKFCIMGTGISNKKVLVPIIEDTTDIYYHDVFHLINVGSMMLYIYFLWQQIIT